MMNKKILIGVALVVLMVVIYSLYSMKIIVLQNIISVSHSNIATTTSVATSSQTSQTTATTPQKSITKTTATTFKSIFNQPGSHTCSYEQISPSSRTAAVIYIADGKMRAEFRTTGSTMTSNLMVYNGGILYVWTEGAGVGTKRQLSSVSELPFIIPKDLTSGSILGTGINNVSWDCHDWSKDNSLLVPPSTVQFK